MNATAEKLLLSPQDYLDGEECCDIKHEYVNGEVYAMSGVSRAHNTITLNLVARLHTHLRGSPCKVFAVDMKTHLKSAGDERFYYPDLHVTCAPRDTAKYYNEHPKLIIEVLSPSTERYDRAEKFHAYRRLPDLEEYLLIAQDSARVEVYRRRSGWDLELYGAGDSFHLESVDLTIGTAEVYEGVELDGGGETP